MAEEKTFKINGQRMKSTPDGRVAVVNSDPITNAAGGAETGRNTPFSQWRTYFLFGAIGLVSVACGEAGPSTAVVGAGANPGAMNDAGTPVAVVKGEMPKPADAPVVVEPTVTAQPDTPTPESGATEIVTNTIPAETATPEDAVEVPTDESGSKPEPETPTADATETLEAEAGGPPVGGVGGAPEGGTQPEPGVGEDVQVDPVIPVVDDGYFEKNGINVFDKDWGNEGILEVRPQKDGTIRYVKNGEVVDQNSIPSVIYRLNGAMAFAGGEPVYEDSLIMFPGRNEAELLAHGQFEGVVEYEGSPYIVINCSGTPWSFEIPSHLRVWQHDDVEENLSQASTLLGTGNGSEGPIGDLLGQKGENIILSVTVNFNNEGAFVEPGLSELFTLSSDLD